MNSTSTHSRLRPTLLALTAALLAAPTFAQESGEAYAQTISVNFAKGTANFVPDTEDSYGLEPVPGSVWTDVEGKSGTDISIGTGDSVATMTFEANNNFSMVDGFGDFTPGAPFMGSYLADNSHGGKDLGPTITVSGVPFSSYDVIVYFSVDANNGHDSKFLPVEVKGDLYTWKEGATVKVDGGSITAIDAGDYFGYASAKDTVTEDSTPEYGKNALRITGLSGETLTIQCAKQVKNGNTWVARGTIAAFQIVCTGEIILPIEPVTFEGVPEGWGTAPTEAYTDTVSGTTQLELLELARQEPEGARARNVMHITGATNTPTVYKDFHTFLRICCSFQ